MSHDFKFSLFPVSYPEHYSVVQHSQPGKVVTVADALQDAVRLSQASAEQFRDDPQWGRLVNGPYSAIRLAVDRRELYDFLHALRGKPDTIVSESITELYGLVVGLGANESNAVSAAGDAAIFDPTRHGEMVAIRHACEALRIPVGKYREAGITFIEVASCQNCPMCEQTNNSWAGTALSVFICDLSDALSYTDEGYDNLKIDAPPTVSWGVTAYDQPALKMSALWVGNRFPELREGGRQAMSTFKNNGGTCYQPL